MPEPPQKKRAIALSYERGTHAPRVTASGTGLVAERILAAAREAGVPVREDRALTEALSALEIDREVPAELWVAVAQTLAWAYQVDAKARRGGHGRARP